MASHADEDVPSRSHSESSDDSDSQDSEDMRKDTSGPRKSSDGKAKKPVNKDPNRVKRKKARRACENCQRAHLTCSDQRPCERCGDKKVCKDGKRKKAKYLDGTADEDLIPVQEKEQEAQRAALNRVGQRFSGAFAFPGAGPSAMYPGQQTTPSNFPMYPASGTQNQMTSQPFGNPLLPMTQQVTLAPYQQSSSSMPGFSGPLQPNPQMAPDLIQNAFSDGVWPPDFEMDNSDFANNYGRLEYHALGHMSSRIGTGDSDPNESVAGFEPADGSNYAPGVMSTSYGSSPTASQQFQYSQPDAMQQEAIAYNLGGQGQEPFVKQEDVPGIGLASTTYLPSPASGQSPQGMRAGFEGNSTAKDMHTNISTSRQAQGLREPPQSLQQNATSEIPTTAALPTQSSSKLQTSFSRRSRNPSTIYNTVTEPYSYTKAFHDLMALIRKRFSQRRTAHIAKALASIRPSFISSLTKLDDDDRVFMEKCLQRTLLEYEDHLSLTGTPTILCRRTGEIVAINEGFSILTGWRKSVLLGKDPNLNVNKGGDAASSSVTGTSTSRGTNTPRIPDSTMTTTLDDPRPKPVSIVELLDDESACDFFDDYAHLAFGDSRGSIRTPCKLLKYRTSKDAASSLDNEVGSRLKRQANGKVIGSSDGDKVECMLCWSVKRDVFDIPMLFVMNFLPCI